MTDITRLQAIDALIALDHPEWERDGNLKLPVKGGGAWLRFSINGNVSVSYDSVPWEAWRIRRKRPTTVTLTDVLYEDAVFLSDRDSQGDSAAIRRLGVAARRALEALEQGEDT